MWIDFFSYTFVRPTNYDLELKINYSTEILSHALVSLYLPYIFYLFEILRHYPALFQSNHKMTPIDNQIPKVYSAILIALDPTLEVDFGCSSYVTYL